MPKQDRLSELISIYSALSRNEKEIVSIYTKAFTNRSHKDFKEISDLIDLINDRPDITRAQAVKELKIDKLPKMQQNLILLRTRDIVLESLIFSQNIDRPGEYSNQFRNRMLNQKRIEQAKIFLSRGEREIAENLLGETESRAAKYEMFDQLAETKSLLKLSYTTYRAARTINRYEEEINRANDLAHNLNKAKNIYLKFLFYLNRDDDTEENRQARLAELRELETSSRSASIGYLRAMAEVSLMLKEENYEPAIKLMQALVENKLYSPPLQSDQGVSHLKFSIGEAQVFMGDYSSARISFEEADSLVKNDTYESYKNRRNLFLVDFYEGNMDKMGAKIEKRISSFYTSRVPYASAFYHMLKAVFLIQKKEFLKAAEILSSELDAVKDNSDSVRFYRNLYLFMAGYGLIMSKKRLGDNYCTTALKNLQALSPNNLTEREKLIITVLSQIRAPKYNMKRFMMLNSQQLDKLESDSKELRWTPLSDEIVPVENWIRHQLDRRRNLTRINS
jgi:hypothetical protein